MKPCLASPLFTLALLAPLAAWSQVSVSISLQPPPLPVYVQPAVPGEGYIWTPGYWAWNASEGDYFWIPGTWVLAPRPGYLWTPGYWGYNGGGYRWSMGYWATRVGFYGGVNYGYGYGGSGYQGGRWDRGAFHYNAGVSNVDRKVVHNVYDNQAVNNYNVPRVSYNGGPHGVASRPTATEQRARTGAHIAPTQGQVQHERAAFAVPGQRGSANQGPPHLAATARPSAPAAPVAVRAPAVPSAHPAPAPQRQAQPVAPTQAQAQHEQPRQVEPQQAQGKPAQRQRAQAKEAQPQRAPDRQPQSKPQAEPRGQQRQIDER